MASLNHDICICKMWLFAHVLVWKFNGSKFIWYANSFRRVNHQIPIILLLLKNIIFQSDLANDTMKKTWLKQISLTFSEACREIPPGLLGKIKVYDKVGVDQSSGSGSGFFAGPAIPTYMYTHQIFVPGVYWPKLQQKVNNF